MEGFTRRLGLEPHERGTLLLMGALSATLMCGYTIAKVLRDALFLSEFNGLTLPYAYIGVALASVAFVWLEARVQRRFMHLATSRFSQYVAILFSAAAAISYPLAPHRTAAAFYLWTGSQAMLLLPHFWVLALDVWDSQRARRIFPILGGCGLIGGMVAGAFTATTMHVLGNQGLMWVLSGTFLLAHLLTRVLERYRARRPSPAQLTSAVSPWHIMRDSHYIRVFAIGLALSVVVSTLVDFQFKLYIQRAIHDPHALTRFLGQFYVGLNAAALLFQFGAAGWLMRRFGLAASTGLQPTAVLLFAPVVALSTGWWAVIAMRWIQGVTFQTLGKPSAEIYYAAIPPNDRRRVKPAIDTLVERWSDAAVGVLLIVALRVFHAPLAVIAIATAITSAIWFIVLLQLNRQYGKAFQQVLSSRWLDPDEAAETLRVPAARRALVEALAADDERSVVLALELCAYVRDSKIAQAIQACLHHPSPVVVTTAVRMMEALRLPDPAGVIEGFLGSDDESLRRAAVGYLLWRARQPVVFARRLLEGDDPALRRYAVEALVSRPAVAAGAITVEWIDARIATGTRDDRLLAANALGTLGGPAMVQRLRPLLADEDLEIRRAALRSATRRPSRDLLDDLLGLTAVPELRLEVRDAVAAIGDAAVPELARRLEGGAQERAFAARALAEIARPSSIRALTTLIRVDDVDGRHLGFQNLRWIRMRTGRPVLPRAMVHRLFLRELAEYRDGMGPGRRHEKDPAPEVRLLAESFREAAEMALDRALTALACWYEAKPLAGVLERLKSGDRGEAAPALEYLGHVLPRKVFRPVRELFEAFEAVETEGETVAALIDAAWNSDDLWLRACAVRASRHVAGYEASRFTGEAAGHALVRAELEALARVIPTPAGQPRGSTAGAAASC